MYDVYFMRTGKEVQMNKEELLKEFPQLSREFLEALDIIEATIADNKLGNILISRNGDKV